MCTEDYSNTAQRRIHRAENVKKCLPLYPTHILSNEIILKQYASSNRYQLTAREQIAAPTWLHGFLGLGVYILEISSQKFFPGLDLMKLTSKKKTDVKIMSKCQITQAGRKALNHRQLLEMHNCLENLCLENHIRPECQVQFSNDIIGLFYHRFKSICGRKLSDIRMFSS